MKKGSKHIPSRGCRNAIVSMNLGRKSLESNLPSVTESEEGAAAHGHVTDKRQGHQAMGQTSGRAIKPKPMNNGAIKPRPMNNGAS